MVMMDDVRRVRSEYAVAFHRYRSRGQEDALRSAYEIGRDAVVSQLSLLEVAEVHHAVLFEAMRGADDAEFDAIAGAAPRFFAEVLATFDMTTRGFIEQIARD
jgi:hypothetical protein